MATTETGKAQQVQYKRKLTEARREQNRRAQQQWRQRQKQRRDQESNAKILAELKRTENVVTTSFQDGPTDSVGPSEEADAFTSYNQDYVEQAIPSGYFSQTDEMHLSIGPLGNSLTEQTDIDFAEPPAPPDPDLPLPVAVYYYVPPDPSTEDMRYLWAIEENIDNKIYVKPPPRRPLEHRAGASTNFFPPTRASSTLLATPPLWQSSSMGDNSSHDSSEGSPFPSLYLNHLQLVGESCFAATLSIAKCLGIPRPAYINDHPSPFTTSSNADIHKIPVDLRPSGYQLVLPHPCYLDCIPFPHFRNMAVYLSSIKKLDHCSLFLDLVHDGLVCWGSTRANVHHGRSMRDGVAWSKRSWEARKWFWKKWGWIARMSAEEIDNGSSAERFDDEDFDDEDGMLSGSQWWWAQQAEEEEPDFANTMHSGSAVDNSPIGEEEYGSFLSRMVTCNVGIRKPHEVVLWD